MGRKAKFTDDELELLAYQYFKTHTDWPKVQQFMTAFPCSCERATRAIKAARRTAKAAVPATLFEALAVYAGFKDIDDARQYLKELQQKPGNISQMKKRDLRASVIMLCPEEYAHNATTTKLREILKEHGYSGNRYLAWERRLGDSIALERRVRRPAIDRAYQRWGLETVEEYRREKAYVESRRKRRRS